MIKKFCTLITLLVCSVSLVYAYTDQTTTERILKENTKFIEFINVTMTNFGEEKKDRFKKIYESHIKNQKDEKLLTAKNDIEKKAIQEEYENASNDPIHKKGDSLLALYKRVYSKHFNAEVAFLQADYKRAFKRIYASQNDLATLYQSILYHIYLEDAKKILDTFAPTVIKSKNARARLYLTLGYRDRTVSDNHYRIGEASNPRLFSYKIFQYEEAIKMARRAKRYGFLALFESQDIDTKRKIYHQLIKSEKKNIFYKRFIGLDNKKFLTELNKTYQDYEEDVKKLNKDPKTKLPFERKVRRRVRFRYEKRAARFLLNGEFDKAEDVLRKYVKDFNFKLIGATFELLTEEGKKSKAPGAIDYTQYKVHLQDNYSRLNKKSVLTSILKNVKVEDNIQISKKNTSGSSTKKDTTTDKTKKKDNKTQ